MDLTLVLRWACKVNTLHKYLGLPMSPTLPLYLLL